jgi:hypothetical protein
MELGHFPPPGEKKIVLIAEILEQNTDELLALAGKVSSDLIEIILQRPKETAALLRRLLRRGRKYRMKVFAVAQEFEVNAWKIAGEGGLRRAFTVLYLGASAYQALSNIKDKAQREQLRGHFDRVPYPRLMDVKGRFYPAQAPDLAVFL